MSVWYELRAGGRRQIVREGAREAAKRASMLGDGVVYEIAPGRAPRAIWREGDPLPAAPQCTVAPDWVPMEEAVKLSGRHHSTLSRAVSKGELVGELRPGGPGLGKWFFEPASLDQWIVQRTGNPREGWLTTGDAVARSGVHTTTITLALRKGQLVGEPFKINGVRTWLIEPSSFDLWLARRRKNTKAG